MKNFIWLVISFIAVLGCHKNDEESLPEVEPWKTVFPDITEAILDARVNGAELDLITEKFLYRIKGETILEKRPLEHTYYNNYSSPVLGRSIIFRLVNYDSVAYLEFQPIQPGGNVKRISYDELGDDKLTFPITHGFGARNNGQFDDQNNFLFVGFDYPSIQQFTSLLKIDYDRTSNTILDVSITNRLNLYPTVSSEGSAWRAEEVFEGDGIFFISLGLFGGIYRYAQDALDYYPNTSLLSVFKEGSDFYGINAEKMILKSSDMGMTWVSTGLKLHEGWALLKEGDYYIETTENDQLFRAGKHLDELAPISLPPYQIAPYHFAEILYYHGSYLLYGNIDGKNQIFKRSSLL